MKPLFWFLSALVVLGFVATSVPAKPGEATLYLLHDVPDDGYTYVGNPVHFGYVLLDADGTTSVHKQGKIKVTQNDVILYETDADASHDYDALNTFEIAFPVPGPYQVHVEIPGAGSVVPQADFSGYVWPNEDGVMAHVEIDMPDEVPDGTPIPITVKVTDHNGTLIPHSDAILEVRRPADEWLVFRTHLHTHEDAMKLFYIFPGTGGFLVRVVAYMAFPTAEGVHFAPVAATKNVLVTDGQPGSGSKGAPEAPTGTPSSQDAYRLFLTIDPQASTTPWSRFVVSGLVYDVKNDRFLPHVNFEARIDDPVGFVVFQSASLHEYDGVYDAVINLPYASEYTLTLKATHQGWVGLATQKFTVAEVLPTDGTPLPSAAGAVIVKAQGLDALKSGLPSHIRFDAETVAGTPAMHSEIDYQILRTAWGPPLLQNKLHTHDSGSFEVDVTFPEPGDYLLVVDPVTIHGDVSPQYYYGQVGGKLTVPLKVAMGTPLPVELPPTEADGTDGLPVEQKLPGFGLLAALGSAAGAVFLRRRQ